MPELPEVEVLVRNLSVLLEGKTVRAIEVRRAKSLRPGSARQFKRALRGATFISLARRGKYILFTLRRPGASEPLVLTGHLGMTGRMYLLPPQAPLPKHTVAVLMLRKHRFVFEDTRYFGRLTLDPTVVDRLGPEPLGADFTSEYLAKALQGSKQAIKVKLLDQTIVAGLGNIYASEALFRAGISPATPARSLTRAQIGRLRNSIRAILRQAIACGSTVPLDYSGTAGRDRLFYFGRAAEAEDFYTERLQVYDREGQPCPRCERAILRIVQAGRSTFWCARCQR